MEDWEEDLMVGSYDPTQNAMLKGVLRFPLGLYSKKEKVGPGSRGGKGEGECSFFIKQ